MNGEDITELYFGLVLKFCLKQTDRAIRNYLIHEPFELYDAEVNYVCSYCAMDLTSSLEDYEIQEIFWEFAEKDLADPQNPKFEQKILNTVECS